MFTISYCFLKHCYFLVFSQQTTMRLNHIWFVQTTIWPDVVPMIVNIVRDIISAPCSCFLSLCHMNVFIHISLHSNLLLVVKWYLMLSLVCNHILQHKSLFWHEVGTPAGAYNDAIRVKKVIKTTVICKMSWEKGKVSSLPAPLSDL